MVDNHDALANADLELLQGGGTLADDAVLLQLNQRLLESVASNNVELYSQLCAKDLACIEPETQGHIVHGLGFHRFFFQEPTASTAADASSKPLYHVIMANTRVTRLGDTAALICYNRIQQVRDDVQNKVTITTCSETRIWKIMEEDNKWRCIHFHRS